MVVLRWDDSYPSPASLRPEVNAMSESIVEVLLDRIPPSEVAGIYGKGSAWKIWDSPVDYVPEISDVDVHLLFKDDAGAAKHLGTVEAALEVQSRIEVAYRNRVSSPIHTPRPQLVLLNKLLQDPSYSPSPKETVTTLHGADYPDEAYDEQRERDLAAARLLDQSSVLEWFPLHVVDKPGPYLMASLRALTWRVSPTAPRVLVLKRVSAKEAWSLNRTKAIALLEEMGEAQLANEYARFYLSAWEYFLSGYADSEAARKAIRASIAVIEAGAEVARKAQESV